MLRKRIAAVVGAVGLLLGAQGASAISLTLSADRPLDNLNVGDMFEVIVGITEVSEIAAYTLDFSFGPELDLVGASQLAADDLGSGFFTRADFTLDPLSTGNRASVLTVADTLRVDVGSNFPPGNDDGRFGLFALKFMAAQDGAGDVVVGFLDPRADAISQPGGGEIQLDPDRSSLAYQVGSVVPEPAIGMLAVAAMAFAALRRRA